MNLDALYSELTLKTKTKLALLVLDGLGDGGLDHGTGRGTRRALRQRRRKTPAECDAGRDSASAKPDE